jgi:hypothetical protein
MTPTFPQAGWLGAVLKALYLSHRARIVGWVGVVIMFIGCVAPGAFTVYCVLLFRRLVAIKRAGSTLFSQQIGEIIMFFVLMAGFYSVLLLLIGGLGAVMMRVWFKTSTIRGSAIVMAILWVLFGFIEGISR